MAKKNHDSEEGAAKSQAQMPALPPPDDPLRRAAEADSEEYDSKLMAEKRLEAIRKTREMPTADEESTSRDSNEKTSKP